MIQLRGLKRTSEARYGSTSAAMANTAMSRDFFCGIDHEERGTVAESIIYTFTDEAPALATYSLLPVIRAYASTAGVDVETRDISLAGGIIAHFPEYRDEGQRIAAALGDL